MRVTPDFLAIGPDTAPLRVPLMPASIEELASLHNAILPSAKIARLVEEQAGVNLGKVGRPNESSALDYQNANILSTNAEIEARLSAKEKSPTSALIAGEKKFVVVGPNLTGAQVAIFSPAWDQGYSTAHGWYFVDYSHGARFVSREALLGRGGKQESVDLLDIFMDPKLHVLVSDQGEFVPTFPNTGAKPLSSVVVSAAKPPATAASTGSVGGAVGSGVGWALGAALGTALLIALARRA